MEFEPTLSPRFVAYVRDYLMDHGVDPESVFAKCGIVSSRGEEFDTAVPVQQVVKLFELAAETTDNPCMGLHMGRQYHYESSSLLILAMVAASSVEEGIKCLHRFDKYVDTGIETSFDFDQPLAEFGARLIVDQRDSFDQLNEYLMAFIVQALSTATRKTMPLVKVWLCHHNEQNRKQLEDYFGATVVYAQPYNKLFFDRDFLRERFFTSNSLLYDILTKAMKTYFIAVSEQSGFIDIVSREIIRGRGDEPPSAEKVASKLAISPRTLRRRLAEEGYSFQEAKNLAREKHAKYYLGQTNMPLAEIAFELGFSELSAFSRAFRAWSGETPQSYRAQYRQIVGG